jgi:hypothetical protein
MRYPAHATAALNQTGRTAVRLEYRNEYMPNAVLTVTLGDLKVTAALTYVNTLALRDELTEILTRMEAAGESLAAGNAPVTEYPVAS